MTFPLQKTRYERNPQQSGIVGSRPDATMSKTDAWNVKGLGAEARQAAEEAARRSGLSVGDWLDRIIAGGAAEAGVDTEDMASNQRPETRTAKLARAPQKAPEQIESKRQQQTERRHRPTPAAP